MRRFVSFALGLVLAALLVPVATATPAQAIGVIHTVVGPVISHGADGTQRSLACPILERAYSGGYALSASAPWDVEAWDFLVAANRPADDGLSWVVDVQAYQSDVSYASLRLYVMCATL